MAKILLGLADDGLAARVTSALEGGRHEITPMEKFQPEDFKAAAQNIIEARSDVSILDYWPDENASVKLMQTVSEVIALNHPAFIFIESPGPQASREEILMALNEGGHAFLTADFQPAALHTYVERAVVGPGRLRPRARDPHETNATIKMMEEALGQIRTRNLGFQKVVCHLLSTPVSAQNRKVLVVSDSSYQLEMLKKTLEDHNFQVLTAGNPSDGLNAVINDSPRIIVSDLELEDQTGLEFCQAVKFTHKLGPCYFVICTANQKKIAKVMTPGNGVDDCLLKPSGAHDNVEFVARVAMGLLL
jgi:CheY-like chemotaxis protein